MASGHNLMNTVTSLIAEAEVILKFAETEWEHIRTLQLAALSASKEQQAPIDKIEPPPSKWIEFRQKYEKWYRSCLGVMQTVQFSGLVDFKELYSVEQPDLPSIRTALLTGFSLKNYCGFSDRVENQAAILSSLENEIGFLSSNSRKTIKPLLQTQYVDLSRIDELSSIVTPKFDLTKLIKLCEELNKSYENEFFLAIAMLTRAILDHVPPIFGCNKFSEVANNYSGAGQSFKQCMQHLENSSRKIADSYLHLQIRSKESLPNKAQINFSSDLDMLLAEVGRILS